MENWKLHQLYSLAEWINGMAFREINFSSKGLPVIKIAEIKFGISNQTKFTDSLYDSKYLIEKGDMLFCWSGQPETSIGTFWWQQEKGWLNQHIFKVLPDENIVTKDFFYYILQSLKPRFVEIARNKQTTGLGHVTKKDLERIYVLIPPFEEQKAITKILLSLDNKIELNRQMNATLEGIAKTLFKAWFVDFEPVRANMENRPSESASLEIAKLFPSEFEESEIGLIPKGWNTAKLVEVCVRITKGTTPKNFVEQGINFIKAESLSVDRGFIYEKFSFIDNETNNSQLRSQLQKDDILFSIAGTIGRIARVTEDILPANTNQALAIIRPNKAIIEPLFIELLLSRGEIQHSLLGKTVHAVQANLSLSILGETKFAVPKIDTQQNLFQSLNSLDLSIKENVQQSNTLKEIRDSLLPSLILGKLPLKKNENEVKEEIG